jgi:hypothetical protein
MVVRVSLIVDVSLKARTIFEEAAPVASAQKATPFPEDKPFLAKQFKRAVDKPPAQSHYGPWLPTRTPSPDDQAASPNFSRRIYQQRFDQEHIITMSKMSLFGLISGLMLLGILFFMVGFLVALATLEPAKPVAAPPPSSWSDMSAPPGTAPGGNQGQAQRGVFASMAQQQLSQANSGMMKFVPKALRPLAQQAQTQEQNTVRGAIRGKSAAHGPTKQQPQQDPQQQPAAPVQPGPGEMQVGPGGMPLAPGMQQPWPQQQQQMAQAYVPPPVVSSYMPPPPAAYTPPPYPQR